MGQHVAYGLVLLARNCQQHYHFLARLDLRYTCQHYHLARRSLTMNLCKVNHHRQTHKAEPSEEELHEMM